MLFADIILLAIGVSMDAFAVSIAKGLATQQLRPKHYASVALWFGGFQALMPIVGYFLGVNFASIVENFDHWIAFGLLVLIGLNMIREAIWGEEESQDSNFGVRHMFIMAVATSIDALAVGITMAFLGINIWLAATIIGVITFLLSASGIYLGRTVGGKLGDKAGILGGIVLIAIGIKILVEHLGA